MRYGKPRMIGAKVRSAVRTTAGAERTLLCRGGPPRPPKREIHTASHSITRPNSAKTTLWAGAVARPYALLVRKAG